MENYAAPGGLARWFYWLICILGLWLFISPWILGYSPNMYFLTDYWVFGVALTIIGFIGGMLGGRWEGWVGLAIGAWLFISFLFLTEGGYRDWNAGIDGLVIAIAGALGVIFSARSGRVVT